ncbi:DNA translocase FtsK [Chloroflexia bacterium SDU3-3]|nr:DNA translocase FtsK [Chloroflexia bacterium SDU3-3]
MWFFRKRHPLELAAESAANVIQHQLTRLNLAYRAKSKQHGDVLQQVEFVQPLIATPHEIRIEVDVLRLPRGVSITDLRKPEVCETLAAACKYPVRTDHKKGKNGGFWFVVELQERSAIPRLVRFAEMALPPNAPPLALPIGVGVNGAQQWEDLRDLPHLLIAGATKQGKSVMVNALLCQLAARLPPERLRLYLCDLKGGMELAFYEDLPHVAQFVTRADALPAMLKQLQEEMERRTVLMRKKARDIDGYNYQVGKEKALPYLVVVVDEIANAMLSSDKIQLNGEKRSISSATEALLADLAARARAVGIHLIISTQRPSVDVVTGLIKANFPCRIAFGTASEVDSRVIVDDSSAHGLSRGRMRFRRNMELIELQAPLLTDKDVRDRVAAICTGAAPAEATPESAEDKARRECALLLQVAMADFGGKFPIKELFRHPTIQRAKIGMHRLEELAQRLEAEKILSKAIAHRPRRIRALSQQQQAIYGQRGAWRVAHESATNPDPAAPITDEIDQLTGEEAPALDQLTGEEAPALDQVDQEPADQADQAAPTPARRWRRARAA